MERTKLITRELLRKWGACYDDEKIASLVPEEGMTPFQILDLDIPEFDRMWVILREDVIPASELRLLACDFAEVALQLIEDPDHRSVKAIEVARAFANGVATEEELAAARDAALAAALAAAGDVAGDAARDAARAAAWGTARDAGCAAAWAAARGAAGEAAWATARDAARDAARATARDVVKAAAKAAQIGMVRSVLIELDKSDTL